jgi:heat shock protein HslJ
MKKIALLGIIFFSIFFLYANKRKKNIENLPLLNTKWLLEAMYEMSVSHSADTAYIIFHDDYKISGNLGCNLFFGNYSYGKKRMKLDYLGATKKLCMDMKIEEQFFKALRDDVRSYYIEKKKLYIRNKDKVVCTFEGIVNPK